MSNDTNNPFNPDPQDKGPWLYSGAPQPTPSYVPPVSSPNTTPAPAAGTPSSASPQPSPIPQPPKPAPPKPVVKKAEDASLGSIIDTVEAIIIALVLALTFRAFIVEAFVIPTGSMAPTLLGAHFDVICPKCGYAFKRNAELHFQYASTEDKKNVVGNAGDRAELSNNRNIPSDEVKSIVCPNCQFPIDPDNLPQRLPSIFAADIRNGGAQRMVSFAWANNGDRILVLKYLYALLDPTRFDVIVFKEPMNARDNFIKRLIGLPGETIEVINGDIFIGAPGHSAPDQLLIARKPTFVQKDVWQLVYNNDYYPIDAGQGRSDGSVWTSPWSGANSTADQWNTAGPMISYKADSPGMMQFGIRDPYTYNVLGYNPYDMYKLQKEDRGIFLMRASDLRVETVWTPRDASGTSITLTAGVPRNLFQITWNKDGLDLQQSNPETHAFSSVEKKPFDAPVAGVAHHVAFENVDHSLRLFIDDKLVLMHDVPWTAADALAEMNRQRDEALSDTNKPEIRIAVGGAATLGHTNVSRDLYYTQSLSGPKTANANFPLTLGPDEFFALGDNSYQSLDGRMWPTVYPSLDDIGTRMGIVPRRYLLGKAFFVYWPAGYRITSNDNIPYLSNIPLVPNTGEMRLIR